MGGLGEDTPLPSNPSAVTLFDRGTGHRYQYFYSAGGIRRLPEDFFFPQMSLVTLITSWFSGNESMRTMPYKMLRATEIMSKKERYKLSQMKILIWEWRSQQSVLGHGISLHGGARGRWGRL